MELKLMNLSNGRLIGAATVLALVLVSCRGDQHSGTVMGKYEPTQNAPECWRVTLMTEPLDPSKPVEEHERGSWCVAKEEWDRAVIGESLTVTEQ